MTSLVYRLLLLAFPRRIRSEFGDDMLRMFSEQLRHAGKGETPRLWVDAIVDVFSEGTAERMAGAGAAGRHIVRELRRWRWWMHAIWKDLGYALRLLGKQPGGTFIAILTLALGIGANTAIFSAVHAILLRPLPYPDADRLVMIWEKRQAEGVLNNVVSPADFLDWSKLNGAFEHIAAFSGTTVDMTGSGEPARLPAALVSPPFFDVLGIQPMFGRTFTADEASVGRHRVAILSNGLWQRRFGSDRSIVGSKVVLNAIPYEIVGVLPASFEFPDSEMELWAPLALEGTAQAPTRTLHYLDVYGRLKNGVTLERARAEMDRVGAQLQQQYPEANRNHSAYVSPLGDELRAPVRDSLIGLFAAVAFVLLIACVNVANLLLAKAASRKREMAVRAALGAGRWRLAGQALTESVLLALFGGAAGLLVAKWGIDMLRQLAPGGVPVLGLAHVALDPAVLSFAFVLSIATGLLFGGLPAWHLASQDVNESLKDGGRAPGGVKRRLRLALVVSEIALASLLLVGAGLTLRSFQSVLRAEPGFRQTGLLTAFISLPAARYRDDAKQVATYDEIERRLASIPGVHSVGGTSHLPLSGQDSRTGVTIEGREPTPDTPTRAHLRAVTPDYFRTMGITIKSGRNFAASDASESPFVAIVNETMARRYWPGVSPIGRRLRFGSNPNLWREVVGVVNDVKHWGFDRAVNPEMYLPQKQMVWDGLTYVLLVDGDPAAFAPAVRDQLRAVDADLPLSSVQTMEEVAATSVAARRSAMLLLSVFGALALVLAAAGIYGVMSQLVALRSAEIGIRMTLGAQPGAVMQLILREGVVHAAAGLALGLGAAVLMMRGFRSALYQVSPADPVTLTAVAGLLLATTLMACYVPARRAMRVDPVHALRG